MVGRSRGNRVGLAAARHDVRERLLPALLEADPEARLHEPHVGAHEPGEEDVADAVVGDVGPVDPALLHEHALEAGHRGRGRDLAGVVRLDATDRHERVAALRQRVGHEVLELARLVPAERVAPSSGPRASPTASRHRGASSAAAAAGSGSARTAAETARTTRGTQQASPPEPPRGRRPCAITRARSRTHRPGFARCAAIAKARK